MSTTYSPGFEIPGNYVGCAKLCVASVGLEAGSFIPERDPASSAITTNIDYTVAAPTTTPPPPAPVTIGFSPILDGTNASTGIRTVTAQFVATPPLASNQCVEMCFTNDAQACTREYAAQEVCANATVYDANSSTNYGSASASVGVGHIGGDDDPIPSSIVLKQSNITDVRVILNAKVIGVDMSKDVYACSYFLYNRFDKACCGTFTWAGGGTVGGSAIESARIGTGTAGEGGLIPLGGFDHDPPALPEL